MGTEQFGWKNSYLVVHHGNVVGRSDKSHPVPLLESDPGMLDWLVDTSAINPALIHRSVVPPSPGTFLPFLRSVLIFFSPRRIVAFPILRTASSSVV